jgi:amino acid adenylation domain-containing protein
LTARGPTVVRWTIELLESPRAALSVHQLVELSARLTPDACAVVDRGKRFSYERLNRDANRLARALCDHGADHDVRVGISLDRRYEMVVALLAVLKTGAAFVPLDSEDPPARRRALAQDAVAHFVIADDDTDYGAPTLALAVLLEPGGEVDDGNPNIPVDQSQLAYVMYTSGSTGAPKGVMVEHRSIVALVLGLDIVGFSKVPTTLVAAPLAFDASTFELWVPLAHGGTCVLLAERVPEPRALRRLLRAEHVDTAWLTKSLFDLVVDEDVHALDPLRTLIIGGEALSAAHVRAAQAALPELSIINGYGPTECTTFSCCHLVERPLPDEPTIPIGRPIADTVVRVVDSEGAPAPVGVTGELLIGGSGVARGYWNRPDLTAERFITLEDDHDTRWYRSGDLVRWRDDGTLDFVGRLDDQLKLRGHRIEPAETEHALLGTGLVRDAAVVVRDNARGARELVGYVVPAGELEDRGPAGEPLASPAHATQHGRLAEQLRAVLRSVVPAYMVPTTIVVLTQLPLTPNGKLDRHALPTPGHIQPTPGSAPAPPRDSIEIALCQIWAEVLGVDRVGIYDSFFDLGGHSLLAVQMAGWVADRLGATCALSTVFDAPTVAALAERLRAAPDRPTRPILGKPPRPAGTRIVGPTATQSLELAALMGGVPVLAPPFAMTVGFRVRGILDVDALGRALHDLVERHEILHSVFELNTDGLLEQVVHAEFDVDVVVADAMPSDDLAAMRCRERALAPLDLSRRPWLRAAALRHDADDHTVVMTVHHLLADGWSMNVMLEDLSALYAAQCERRAPELDPVGIQFADYAQWQQGLLADDTQWAPGSDLHATVEYWRDELAGYEPWHLPADAPDAPPSATMEFRRHVLTDPMMATVTSLGRAADATPFLVFTALTAVIAHALSGELDISVGAVHANRDAPELARTVGCLVEPMTLRVGLDGDPTLAELIERVRAVASRAYRELCVSFLTLLEKAPELADAFSTAGGGWTMLNFEPRIETLQLAGAHVEPVPVDDDAVSSPFGGPVGLAISLQELLTTYALHVFFDPARYRAETIERLLGRYVEILERVAQDPALRLSHLA